MTRKEYAPQGRAMGQKWDCADRANDRARLQYTDLPIAEQYRNNPEQYRRAVRRLFADAFVMLRQMSHRFPALDRYGYFVDRNGCLRFLTGREAR